MEFAVRGVEAQQFTASPTLTFDLEITCSDADVEIHNVLLQAQIQIDSTRRRYDKQEQGRLVDLFGQPDRWSETLRALLWTHAGATVPRFQGKTLARLHVPCTFDFNVAATKYFYALSEGEAPLEFLFSGSIFYAAEDGALRIVRISWEKEAKFRLPVPVWRRMMDHHYPNSTWLNLPRDTFQRLHEYKLRQGIPTWEQAIEKLLGQATEEPSYGVQSTPEQPCVQS